MNRHTKIRDCIDKKNNRLHFVDFAAPSTKGLIKEYIKLKELSVAKQLNKMSTDDSWNFILKINDFKNKMSKNIQTKEIKLNLSTSLSSFDDVYNTELSKFLLDKHIPLF
jgi:hypothetical protein